MVAFSQANSDEQGMIDPTPEEIRDRSRAIRQRWSERTRKRRRVLSRDPNAWSVPTVTLDDIAAAAS
ncbi:hypothetical protein [Roseimaritima sediminicola]|uniref:hypothetical protein n=1 Tax=Roseimaritima sediminicola TaxID=2662066 RepID=UPI00129836FC|nr:hypothetical protein [Roseimaritima sediminicola]